MLHFDRRKRIEVQPDATLLVSGRQDSAPFSLFPRLVSGAGAATGFPCAYFQLLCVLSALRWRVAVAIHRQDRP
jgi:hypothetical protein